MAGNSPRSTLDTLQRLFYAARETAAAAGTTRFIAAMNDDTLKELGREVAMGGVDAPAGLSAACEAAAALPDGPTGVVLWDVALTLDRSLGDSEIKLTPIEPTAATP
jgi:hypothetical protein